jgi:nicotinamide mononucleotide transporter
MEKFSHSTKSLFTYCLWISGSLGLTILSIKHLIPTSLTEVFGFISGALCVWLTVKEHILNWLIGIINSIFFLILFFHARLFASMLLQIVYIILGFLGWYWWLKGGEYKTNLTVTKLLKNCSSYLDLSLSLQRIL